MKMRLREIAMAGIILSVLTFSIAIASAADQVATGDKTPAVEITGAATETLISNPATGTVDDEEADEGMIGPGNALYGLKIAFENIGETFTFNASEKLGKQVANARHRIAEARAALKRNDTEAANRALAEYKAKVDDVNKSISRLSDKDTGFMNARNMILKHQLILKNLSMLHPNNTGLQRAYNNSKELQNKFESRHREQADLNITKGNREIASGEKTGAPERTEKPETGAKRENRN
ncbi:MAG: DUF5667 domain-containing protein [Candidatus Methanoperedens sp.]|nr:DUF5667 domain-containing protein [Candidatus Methanoperedens sp.]